MKNIIALLLLAFLISCTSNNSASTDIDLEGYEQENLGDVTYVYKLETTGVKVSDGYLRNGKKEGLWTTYDPSGGGIQKMDHYVNGALNGPSIVMSKRGQLDSETHYSNGKMNGKSATYKFGRPLKETYYKDDVIDGVHKEYFNNGKLQKEVHFKNGKQHGLFKQYNEEGVVIMQYEYENGEKKSGGVVAPAKQ